MDVSIRNNLTLEDTSSYPQTTLGGTKVPSDAEFSLVLSYDTTHFKWGTALGVTINEEEEISGLLCYSIYDAGRNKPSNGRCNRAR